jgi:hypothetical protein
LDEFRRRSASFDIFGVFTFGTKSLTAPGDPRHVTIVSVAPDLVPALGVAPAIGHWFTDDRSAAITDALWRALGANPNIVGTSMMLDRVAYTITAVMPPRFVMPMSAPGTEGVATDVWIALDPTSRGMDPNVGLFFAYARLKPGVTLDAATAEVKGIGADMAARDPIGHQAYMSKLEDLQDVGVRDQRPTLLLLLAASLLLLVIACANVAGLLLVRSVTRAREIATRIALGASAARLGWQFFLEGALVSIAGAALGILVSMALVRAAMLLGPEFVPRTSVVEMDATVPGCAGARTPHRRGVHARAAMADEADLAGRRARSRRPRVRWRASPTRVAGTCRRRDRDRVCAARRRRRAGIAITDARHDTDRLRSRSSARVFRGRAGGNGRERADASARCVSATARRCRGRRAGRHDGGIQQSTSARRMLLVDDDRAQGHPPGNTERTSFIIASPSYFTTMIR